MYSMMIVEDEPIFLIAFKSLVDWGKLGFEIVHEAYNGADALEKFKNDPVDIVVTDIKMPLMDGIELIGEIKKCIKSSDDCAFIVISAYDDFHMVKKSFNEGAIDYILKPEISTDNLIALFNKVGEQFKSIRKKSMEKSKESYIILRNQTSLKEALFKKLFWGGGYSLHEIQDECSHLCLRFKGNMVSVVVFKVSDNEESYKRYKENEIHLRTFSIINIIEELLNDFSMGDVFNVTYDEFIIVFSIDHIHSEKQANEKIMLICSRIRQCIKQYLNIDITFGVSDIRKLMEQGELNMLYKHARTALEYKYIRGNGSITFYNEICYNTSKISNEEIKTKTAQLRCFLDTLDINDVDRVYNMVSVHEKYISLEDVSKVRILFDRYAVMFSDYAEDHSNIKTHILPQIELYYKSLKKDGDLDELNQWLRSIIINIINYLEDEHQLIRKAKQHIRQHYTEPITLYETADKLNVTEEYLCRLFTKETGKSFITFLNETRVNKAIEYLLTTQMNTTEIAEKVGYTSREYFSRVFRLVTGKTPKEYSKKL